VDNLQAQVTVADEMIRKGTGPGADFLGWRDLPENYDREEFDRILKAAEKIKEEGLSPASTYSVQWHKDFPVETPEETISGFLKMRRRLYQDIGSYTVKDVKVDESGNTATVTFNSKKLHSKGLASSTREVNIP